MTQGLNKVNPLELPELGQKIFLLLIRFLAFVPDPQIQQILSCFKYEWNILRLFQ